MKRNKLTVFIALVLALSLLFAVPAYALTVNEVGKELVCLCGCGNQLISECECGDAVAIRTEIERQISAGKGKEEIKQFFVVNIDRYFPGKKGLEILAAPPKSGFSVLAWVTPFIGLVGGGLVVYFALNKWVFVKDEKDNVNQGDDTAGYDDALDDEMKKYL